MQDTIIKAIETLRDQGATDWEVVEKLGLMIDRDSRTLSQKMAEFEGLTSEDSDRNYKPAPSFEEIKLVEENKKIDKEIKSDVEKLIEKLKKIKDKEDKNLEERGENEETEDGEDSAPDKPKWVN